MINQAPTADMSRFRRVLHLVRATTGKAEAEIVNKALKDVAYRAASFTPKTSVGTIRAALGADNLLAKLASASLKRKQGKFTRAEHRAEMERIGKRRTRGVNALRAGWIPAIQRLGGSFRGAKLNAMGSAAHGTAKAATINHLSGYIQNAVRTTDHVGRQMGAGEIELAVHALDQAITSVTEDRENYAKKKMREALQKARNSV